MSLPKTILFLSFSFFFVIFCLLLSTNVHAQTPRYKITRPYPFPCNKVAPDDSSYGDDEFHSLRPYQSSPCDEEVSETALFCGNSLVISDTVFALQTTPPELAENCTPIGNDRYRCTYKESNSRTIAIDLAGAELPIMGNTELVINSQEQSDPEGLDDAEKVNEYVSWYLNGIINRAEYPFLDPTDEEDISKIIDFSGPLKKLLPWDEQARNRIKTIERAVGKDINKDGLVEEKDRHDQVFACTFGIPIKIFGIWEVARVAQTPVPCYDKGFLSRFADFFDLKDEKRLSDWENHLPPLAEDYANFQDYWVEYKRWRGKSCVVAEVPGPIPVVGGKKFIYCFDNPAKPNYWANLFPYIPFSSTEDRVGLVELDSFGVQPVSEDVTITNVSIKDWSPAELYFAHMQEVSELAEILQQTFVPKDGNMTGGFTGVSPGGACDLVNVRTNEGDDLFAGEIGGILSYDAEFSCDFDRNATESACTKEAIVNLSVLTKTPLADDVWSRTVAGPSAIFKRIFPKVGPEGAILRILDIPAATKVTYTGADFAGNPGNQRSGESAELYFPHIGGVSEYFLKGIQTILRPKGFGEQIISGSEPGHTVGTCQTGFGPCSVENLLPYFGNDLTKATNASMVCHLESGGNSNALNNRCLTDYPPGSRTYDYSVGLFQINLLAHCAGNAFDSGWGPPPYCTILDQAKVNSCKIKYSDPDENIRYAVQLSQNGTIWTPWKTAAKLCGLPY